MKATEKVKEQSEGMININARSINLLVPKKKFENCTCQCRRHTIEAKQQAHAIYERLFFQLKSDMCVQSHNQEMLELPLDVEEALGAKQICIHHMCIFLLTASHLHGVEIAEAVLQQRYPHASRKVSKKSNELHVFS